MPVSVLRLFDQGELDGTLIVDIMECRELTVAEKDHYVRIYLCQMVTCEVRMQDGDIHPRMREYLLGERSFDGLGEEELVRP
jgi:hypothetical protein